MHTRNRPPAPSAALHLRRALVSLALGWGQKHTTSRGLVVALVVQLSCGLAPWLWEPQQVRASVTRDLLRGAGLSARGRA